MSVPGILKVLLDLQTTLQTIRTSSGYHFDVLSESVVLDPLNLQTVNPSQTPFTVVDEDPNEGVNDFGPATTRPTQLKQDFKVRLRTRVDASGADPGRLKIAAWNWYADVETALTRDVTRGAGHVLYTYVQFPVMHWGLADKGQVYVEIPVRILLNRTYGLP